MVKNKQAVILDVTGIIPTPPKEVKYDWAVYEKQEDRERLKRIDFSLANTEFDKIVPVSGFCPCPSCQGHNRLLTWPKRSKLVFGIEGACPFSVGIQMVRIALLKKQNSDENLMGNLLKKARQYDFKVA
jgi:hypothetical protein